MTIGAILLKTTDSPQGEILLQIRDLQTSFYTRDGVVKAVDGVNL